MTEKELDKMNVAQQIVKTLENRGVKYAFGVPGEENISLITELEKSEKINFIVCSDEQVATFMAWMIGWQSDQPALTLATLGPGALNMSVALADATTHSFPLIAIAAQGEIESLDRETKQVVDLKAAFKPLTKFSAYLSKPAKTAELINKAYNEATTDRPGTVFIGVPSDYEREEITNQQTVIHNPNPATMPTEEAIDQASKALKSANKPLLVAGLGANRANLPQELLSFIESHQLPIATTYMAKGIVSENHPQSLGVLGFLVDDYIDASLDDYDLILTVGFDHSELGPDRLNPNQDKTIIHLHNYRQDTHSHYHVEVNLVGQMAKTLSKLSDSLADWKGPEIINPIQEKLSRELEAGARTNKSGVLSPVEIIHAAKKVVTSDDRILVDTGALKMWMARLFPAEKLNQVMVNNAMSSMAWTIPATIANKLLEPNRRILTMIGDGSFNMNSQALIQAHKQKIPMTLVIWVDDGYELIKWKMEMTLGESGGTDFENPDFVKLAEAYGGRGHLAQDRDHLEKLMRDSLEKQDGIDIIVAPVDYSANYELSDRLSKDI